MTRSSLELIQDRPKGKPVAGTFSAGNITMANDVLQRDVVTVFQPPTELNERGNLLRGWSHRTLFPGGVIVAAEITHNRDPKV